MNRGRLAVGEALRRGLGEALRSRAWRGGAAWGLGAPPRWAQAMTNGWRHLLLLGGRRR
jgi:hypothetical protein